MVPMFNVRVSSNIVLLCRFLGPWHSLKAPVSFAEYPLEILGSRL